MFGLFTKINDPVCGMKINKKEAKFSFLHQGKTYFFCTEICRDNFKADPEKYLKSKTSGSCCHS